MDFAVRLLEFHEIKKPPFLADWKELEAVFPLSPESLQPAEQFVSRDAEKSGMQCHEVPQKAGQKLPFTLVPFQAASLFPVVDCHIHVRTSGTQSCLTHLKRHFVGQVELFVGKGDG